MTNRSHRSSVPGIPCDRIVPMPYCVSFHASSPRCSGNRVGDVVAFHRTHVRPTRTSCTGHSTPCFLRTRTWRTLVQVVQVIPCLASYEHVLEEVTLPLVTLDGRVCYSLTTCYLCFPCYLFHPEYLVRYIGSRVRHGLICERIADPVVRGCQLLPGWPTDLDLFSCLRIDSIANAM